MKMKPQLLALPLFILLAGCTASEEEKAEVLDVEPIVDYNFLGGYTKKVGEGFYVVSGDIEAVRGKLPELLKGENQKETFSGEERINLVVFRGVFSTGGYGVKIGSVERKGNSFILHAVYTDPEEGAMVTQAFTQPTAVVPLGRLERGEYKAKLYIERLVGSRVVEEEKVNAKLQFAVE